MNIAKFIILVNNKNIVFALAVVLHISIVIVLGHYKIPVMMEPGHMANNLFEGRGFSFQPHKHPAFDNDDLIKRPSDVKDAVIPFSDLHPTSFGPPGYPYFLFFTWKLLGKQTLAYLVISIVQAILVSSIIFPVGWLTRRWFGEKAEGWAIWVACLMPLYAWYATRFYSAAIVMTFHPWLLAGWLSMIEKNSLRRTVVVGLSTGLAGLFQPILLAVFFLIGIVLLVKSCVDKNSNSIKMLLLAASLVLLVLMPYTIQNYRLHGQLVLIRSGFGKELWIGNNPNSTGTAYIEGGSTDIYVAYPPKCIKLATRVEEIQYFKAMQREAIEYICSDPVAFIMRTLKKIGWFCTAAPEKFVCSAYGASAIRFRFLFIAYWGGFLLLAVLARSLHGRFPGEYTAIFIAYLLVHSVTYGLTHIGQARHRGEIEFIIIPAVAQGVLLLWNMMNRARGKNQARYG